MGRANATTSSLLFLSPCAVVAKLESVSSLVMHVILWSIFPQRAEVFSREQVTLYRFLLCPLSSESAVEGVSSSAGFRLRTVWETLQESVSDEHTPTDMPNPHVNKNSFHYWGQNFGRECRARRYEQIFLVLP